MPGFCLAPVPRPGRSPRTFFPSALDNLPNPALVYWCCDTPKRQADPLNSRGLHVDPRDAVPIWKQIEEGMRRLVASMSSSVSSGTPAMR